MRRLFFELWESDPKLLSPLRATMEHCRRMLQESGHEMEVCVRSDDFVLAHVQRSLFDAGAAPSFDLVIMNPPYYKVRHDSEHAKAMRHVVHGQPNMYALFMAVAADLLAPGGELVAITPRSYFNGPYFKRFRKWFFDRMTARQIHIFGSRVDAFRDDDVLQENVILMAERGGVPHSVLLTTSSGRDFQRTERCRIPYTTVIDDTSGEHVIRIMTNRFEQQVVDAVDGLPQRFRDLGFEISTGPVVSFRCTEFLRRDKGEDTGPLLWMHNVRPFITRFPAKNKQKPTHIVINERSRKLLLPAKRYVLLKRFTSKEEPRRLVAGIVEPTDSYSPWIGLENHLNYIYRPGSELSRKEALGLAAILNSGLVDSYFRTVSGNTQVNASEIRSMPLPDVQTIRRIGAEVQRLSHRTPEGLEELIGHAIGLGPEVIKQFVALAP